MLVQCSCGEFLSKVKEVLRRHEIGKHEYNTPTYRNHVGKLTDDKKAQIVAQGEARLGQHLFFGTGVVKTNP